MTMPLLSIGIMAFHPATFIFDASRTLTAKSSLIVVNMDLATGAFMNISLIASPKPWSSFKAGTTIFSYLAKFLISRCANYEPQAKYPSFWSRGGARSDFFC